MLPILPLVLALLTSACTKGTDTGDPGDDTGAIDDDADDDGVPVGQDCDDADASVGGARTWFADADGDGFGDPATSVVECEPPAGYLAEATDCDDTRAEVNPDATEQCDGGGVDEDCDGLLDGDDPGAEGVITTYADADGDGFGDAGSAQESCSVLPGFTTDATDCDDTSAAAFPGGVEVCDGVDNDCDTATSEDGLLVVDGSLSFASLAEAYEGTSEGSVIDVCTGTWPANLVIEKSLSIRGHGGEGAVVLDGGGNGAVLVVEEGDFVLSGVTVTGGTGQSNGSGSFLGGGVIAWLADTVTVEDCIIEGNTADYGGGLVGSEEGATTLTRVQVRSNAADVSGGGLYLFNTTLTDSTIASNRASYGGGFYIHEGTVTLSGTTVEGNTATTSGGGAYSSSSSALDGGTYTGNTATNGGGVYVSSLLPTTHADITGNLATYSGGGLQVSGDGDVSGVTITGNTALWGGGALLSGGEITLSDTVISGNEALEEDDSGGVGGGFYAAGATLTFTGVTVSDNEAQEGAGAGLQEVSAEADDDTHFTSNVAENIGGGLYVNTSSAWQGGVFEANEADFGGGIAADLDDAATASLEEVQVLSNVAVYGAGLYVGCLTLLEDAIVQGNAAEEKGGGLLVLAELELEDTTITENEAKSGAGMVLDYGSATTMTGGAVSANVATDEGGGAYLVDGTLAVVGTDWGTGATDNAPDDVYLAVPGLAFSAWGAASIFTCDDAAGCE